MAYSNHNKYVSYPDWFGSQKQQVDSKTGASTTIVYRGGGASDTGGGSGTTGITGITVTGSGNAVTSGILDGTTIVLNKDLTFVTDQSSTNTFWELREDLNGKQYLYANYDIATLGGHTMYVDGDDTLNLPELYDGIPIDNVTIYWDTDENGNKVLKSVDTGSGGGGVADKIAWVNVYGKPSWITDYKPIYDYSEIQNVPDLSGFVTIEGYQEIEGVKNFLNGLQISGLPITKLSGYEDVIYIDANVVVRGGLTMYSTGEVDIPSLTESIVVDNVTLVNDNGVLKINPDIQLGGITEEEYNAIVSMINTKWTQDNNKISHWDTAYGWGNHAAAGYVTLTYLTEELKKYVTLTDYQEIDGVKNFLNGLQISDIPITKLQDDVLYIDSNVVIRGGLTMYYDNGEIDLPSIKDEIGNAGYDGVTGLASFDSSQFVIGTDGTVSIISGSGGLNTEELKSYLDTNKYTTETWVKEQGYASASSLSSLQNKVNDFLEGSDTDTIINKWKELEAFLSGLSESDNLATILGTKADKTITISAGTGLTGGGTLAANRTLSLATSGVSAGTYKSVTVDTYGRVTSGSNPTTLAGYGITDAYTKTQVDNTFALYIPIAGYTNVTGEKNFTGGLKVNGSPIYYDATNKYWKLEGDLLVTGGVTMYGTDEGDIDSILDSLPIASTSSAGIAYFDSTYFSVGNDGKVTLTSAPSSISTLGSLLNVEYSVDSTTSSDVVMYKAANSSMWSTKLLSEIGGSIKYPLHWIGYDNGTWDGSSNGIIIIPTSLKNPNALTFTGAVSATYDGSSAVTVNIPVAGGDIDLSNYLPLSGGTLTGDVNFGNTSNTSNLTLSFNRNGHTGSLAMDSNYTTLAYHQSGSGYWDLLSIKRGTLEYTSDTGKTWNTILHSGNYSNYALPLSGGTITNTLKVKQAVGLWIQKASTQTSSTSVPYIRFGKYTADDTADNTTVNGELGINDSKELVFYKGTIGGSWLKVLHEDNYSSYALPKDGNAVSATKLKTPRTIWGQSFDGTGNITEPPKVYKDTSSYISFYSANGSTYYGDLGFYNGSPSIWTSALLWKTILHEGNYSSYTLPLSGGTITGAGNKLITLVSNSNNYVDICYSPKGATYTWQVGAAYNNKFYFYNNNLKKDVIQIDQNGVIKLIGASDDGRFTNLNYSGIDFQGSTGGYAMGISTYNNDGTPNGHLAAVYGASGTFQYWYFGGTYNSHALKITADKTVTMQEIEIGYTNEINALGSALYLNYRGSAIATLGNNGQSVVIASDWAALSDSVKNRMKLCPLSVRGPIFSYGFNLKQNSASFVFDKNGNHFTGIGTNGETDTIYFGAVNENNMLDWVSYSQIWKFGGSIITTGGITMYSDIRKKQKLQDVELSLSQIANAPLIEHYYLSDQNKTTHVGSIAQYWAGLNDWFCKLDAEGYYTMEIQNAALASAISIARHLERYESKTDKKIRQLKKRISQLEDEIELLKKGA